MPSLRRQRKAGLDAACGREAAGREVMAAAAGRTCRRGLALRRPRRSRSSRSIMGIALLLRPAARLSARCRGSSDPSFDPLATSVDGHDRSHPPCRSGPANRLDTAQVICLNYTSEHGAPSKGSRRAVSSRDRRSRHACRCDARSMGGRGCLRRARVERRGAGAGDMPA